MIAVIRGGSIVGVYGPAGTALTIIDHDLIGHPDAHDDNEPLVWTEDAMDISEMDAEDLALLEEMEAE